MIINIYGLVYPSTHVQANLYINLMDIIGNILNSLRYSQVCDESRNVYARFYL